MGRTVPVDNAALKEDAAYYSDSSASSREEEKKPSTLGQFFNANPQRASAPLAGSGLKP
jgi:hypothetical protein